MNDEIESKLRKERNRNRTFGAVCALVAVSMVGAAYAAVPLYNLFCSVTGFGGTTQRAESVPDQVLERVVTVRFDSSVAHDLPWRFKPQQRMIDVKIGEPTLAFYEAENLSDKTVMGTASFNVSPPKAGAYFTKVECFCFTEQVLEPGQKVDMPVTFYVDPEMVDDWNLDDVKTITLSYTFFPVKDPEQLAALSKKAAAK